MTSTVIDGAQANELTVNTIAHVTYVKPLKPTPCNRHTLTHT